MFPLLGWGSRLQESLPREGLLCESKLKLPPSLLPGQPPQRPVTRPAALLRLRTDGDLCTFTPALQGPSWMPTTCHAAGTGLWERVLDKTHRILTAGSIKRKQMTVNPGLAPVPSPPLLPSWALQTITSRHISGLELNAEVCVSCSEGWVIADSARVILSA